MTNAACLAACLAALASVRNVASGVPLGTEDIVRSKLDGNADSAVQLVLRLAFS